jgi:hypothetical protein
VHSPDEQPLVKDVPRRPDPGVAGSRKLAQISQIVGFGWAAFWWFLAPSEGAARWYVGAAGAALVIGVRIFLRFKGSELVDISHLRCELDHPAVRRGDRGSVRLTVLDPTRVRGDLHLSVMCRETYHYRTNSDNHGPRRQVRSHVLWDAPLGAPTPGRPLEFQVPPELPFSWEGTIVKYTWTVTATEKVERGLDPTIELPFSWEGTIVKYRWTVTATEKVARGLDPTIELPLEVLP